MGGEVPIESLRLCTLAASVNKGFEMQNLHFRHGGHWTEYADGVHPESTFIELQGLANFVIQKRKPI